MSYSLDIPCGRGIIVSILTISKLTFFERRNKMTSEKYIGIEISKINNLMKRDLIKTAAENDTENLGKHGWIIGFLAEHQNEDIFQKDIETNFSIRRSTVSNMLKLMEQKGFITRESVSGDARSSPASRWTFTAVFWNRYVRRKSFSGGIFPKRS